MCVALFNQALESCRRTVGLLLKTSRICVKNPVQHVSRKGSSLGITWLVLGALGCRAGFAGSAQGCWAGSQPSVVTGSQPLVQSTFVWHLCVVT